MIRLRVYPAGTHRAELSGRLKLALSAVEGPSPFKADDKRDAGEFAAEVGGVALPVLGMVQDGVDVVEDVPFGDGRVVVVGRGIVRAPSR